MSRRLLWDECKDYEVQGVTNKHRTKRRRGIKRHKFEEKARSKIKVKARGERKDG